MQKEFIDYKSHLDKHVKVFLKGKRDPTAGRLDIIQRKYIVLLAKKAIKNESKIVYVKKSIRKDDIEKIISL